MLVTDKHAKGRAQNAARAAKAEVAAATGALDLPLWIPPTKEDCDRIDSLVMPQSETRQVIVVMSYIGKRIVYYCLKHEVFDRGTWHQVVRIDCSHGTVHKHRFTSSGGEVLPRAVLVSLYSEEDVLRSYDESYSAIIDNLDENERLWRNG